MICVSGTKDVLTCLWDWRLGLRKWWSLFGKIKFDNLIIVGRLIVGDWLIGSVDLIVG